MPHATALYLFFKAFQPGLFDQQVQVSGHVTKRGTSTKLNSGDLADKSVTQRSNVVGRMVTIDKPAIAKAWRPRYLFLKAAA